MKESGDISEMITQLKTDVKKDSQKVETSEEVHTNSDADSKLAEEIQAEYDKQNNDLVMLKANLK